MVKERRKKRITILPDGRKIITIRTYKRHKKRLKELGLENYAYDFSKKIYRPKSRISKKVKKPPKKIKKVPAIRIRRQIAQNFRTDLPPYFAYIRALTLNPYITQRGLIQALGVGKQLFEKENNISFRKLISGASKDYTGLEITKLGSGEDPFLTTDQIHIEVFVAYMDAKRNLIWRKAINI